MTRLQEVGCEAGPKESDPIGEWVGIAANASSGLGAGRRRVKRLTAELNRQGLAVRTAWTPAERSDLVAEASRDPLCRCLVAAGGDGTVAALVNEPTDVPVTVLPVGTENLFARHFGIRRRPASLAATITRGHVERMDLGLASGRRFTLMAGFGFDADVVSRHHLARLDHSGALRPTHRAAYVEPVLRSSFGYRFPPLTITVLDPPEPEPLVGTTAFVFNLPRYAMGLPIAPTARADDGLLDLVVFRNPGPLRALHYLWLVVLGRHLHRPDVQHRRVRRVSIASPGPVPVQLDGDPGGIISDDPRCLAFTVEVLPRALNVLVPASYSAAPV